MAHHKFVKTTPKPNATKNRSGDEFWLCCGGVLPGDPLDALVSVGEGEGETDVGPILDAGVPENVDDAGATDGVDDANRVFVLAVTACLTTIRAPSTKAWLSSAILSTGRSVQFAKNSHDGYHALDHMLAWTVDGWQNATGRPMKPDIPDIR